MWYHPACLPFTKKTSSPRWLMLSHCRGLLRRNGPFLPANLEIGFPSWSDVPGMKGKRMQFSVHTVRSITPDKRCSPIRICYALLGRPAVGGRGADRTAACSSPNLNAAMEYFEERTYAPLSALRFGQKARLLDHCVPTIGTNPVALSQFESNEARTRSLAIPRARR